jgi:hypothetical protein
MSFQRTRKSPAGVSQKTDGTARQTDCSEATPCPGPWHPSGSADPIAEAQHRPSAFQEQTFVHWAEQLFAIAVVAARFASESVAALARQMVASMWLRCPSTGHRERVIEPVHVPMAFQGQDSVTRPLVGPNSVNPAVVSPQRCRRCGRTYCYGRGWRIAETRPCGALIGFKRAGRGLGLGGWLQSGTAQQERPERQHTIPRCDAYTFVRSYELYKSATFLLGQPQRGPPRKR